MYRLAPFGVSESFPTKLRRETTAYVKTVDQITNDPVDVSSAGDKPSKSTRYVASISINRHLSDRFNVDAFLSASMSPLPYRVPISFLLIFLVEYAIVSFVTFVFA